MTRYNIILLLVAMVSSGLLGGIANYLLLYKDDPEYAQRSRSCVLGLVAALLVPVILKTISSDIITNISSLRYGSGIPFDFMVFTSLCLLAAIFSRTIAETIGKRLAAEVEKAQRESVPKTFLQCQLEYRMSSTPRRPQAFVMRPFGGLW